MKRIYEYLAFRSFCKKHDSNDMFNGVVNLSSKSKYVVINYDIEKFKETFINKIKDKYGYKEVYSYGFLNKKNTTLYVSS